jgi:pyrroloquinoline quinone biosynthesis protein E
LNVLPENLSSPDSLRHADLPTPKPNLQAYDRERRLALLSSPRRLLNYLRFRLAIRRPNISHWPIKLDIENVSRCNFACTMCQVSDWPGRQRAEDMSLVDFQSIIDGQPGLVEIKIQGMGEPTMQGDAFFDMIRYARRKHIWVRTTTNASLLHLNDNHAKLIDSGVNDVQVSLDGATAATYEAIRRGGKFDRVTQNCRLLNDYAREKGNVGIQMWVVVQRTNLAELEALVDLASKLRFGRLTFALDLNDWGQDAWRDANSQLAAEHLVDTARAFELVEQGRASGIAVGFWTNTTKYSARKPETICSWPFERAYVSSDMRVVPCCMIGNPDVADLGDANAFESNWFGQSYADFRQSHLDGNIPRACQGCYEEKL